MKKSDREKHIKELLASPDVRRMVDLNMFSVEDLVDQFDKQADLVVAFKTSLIDGKVLDNLLANNKGIGTMEQQTTFLMTMLKCMPALDKFDDAVYKYLPIIALMTVMMNKQNELLELQEAISS